MTSVQVLSIVLKRSLSLVPRVAKSSRFKNCRRIAGISVLVAATLPLQLRTQSAIEPSGRERESSSTLRDLNAKICEDADLDSMFQRIDRLNNQGNFGDAYEVLEPFKDSQNIEVLWRFARACAKRSAASTDNKEKGKLCKEGLDALERIFQQDENCGRAHQWSVVLLHEQAWLNGKISMLKISVHLRKHMERAVECLPNDSIVRTMLGMWFYEVSQLNWVEHRVMQLAGNSLPPSCIHSALHWFEDAERVNPGCSLLNLLMLGRTLLKLGREKEALSVVRQAASGQPYNTDDVEAQRDARTLLEQWPSSTSSTSNAEGSPQ